MARTSINIMDPVKIIINGQEVVTTKGKTVIQAAAEAGVAIPHYCYHPKLSIAGNCRMCMVEIEKMPKLQIACNTQVAEGMSVLTQSPKVVAVRKAVLEFLLINHPVDCPICDQAGECQLQNYYMEHDRQASRLEVGKIHDRKKTIFGPNVVFDGERCIKCTRCVRFCQEITKTNELAVINRGDHSTISLFDDAVLDNPLSANVVDICPVGALTDRDFRFKVRVWYLDKTPSICPGCSTGCNISVEAYQNKIARFKPRQNEAVNSHWICDEGRYCFHESGRRRTADHADDPPRRRPSAGDLGNGVAGCGQRIARRAAAGGDSLRAKYQRRGLFVRQAAAQAHQLLFDGSFLSGTAAHRSAKDSNEPGPFAEFPRRPRHGGKLQRRLRGIDAGVSR